ncbi:MAG: transporter substrate-binding domain-containing protein [Chloroflexota bacterium]
MKRLLLLLSLLLIALTVTAQDDPAPTLVPPTPVPVQPTGEPDFILTESTVARLQNDGVLRVGILYNEIPFGQYSIRGELAGFDADLARLLAETWEVELEFVQVTRQNRFDLLSNGTVDLLLAAVVHDRALDASFEFSHSYRLGGQVIMVESEPDTEAGEVEIASIFNLSGLPVGYVVGTEGEITLNNWIASSGVQLQPRAYLTYDQMLAALFGGEVIGIAGRDTRLLRTATSVLDAVKILDTTLQEESFAIAMLRQDLHFRNLINRTLQYLASDADIGQPSTLEQLHTEYFPNDDFPYATLPIYNNVGDDAPVPSQFPMDVPIPQTFVATNILTSGIVRVAGAPAPESVPPEQATLATVNRNLAQQIAERWGVQVQFVDGDPIQLIASGQADLAVGITPDWDTASQVDFSQPYVQHGRRLMYPESRDWAQFSSLQATTRIIATFRDEPDAEELAEAWASSVGIFNLRFFGTDPENAVETILENNNALVVFGDTFKLLPIVRSNDALALGPTWYDRQFLTLALPQNDVDFRRLVNYTLQEMLRDGSLTTVTAPIIPDGERAPNIGIWSGSSQYLGLNLAR